MSREDRILKKIEKMVNSLEFDVKEVLAFLAENWDETYGAVESRNGFWVFYTGGFSWNERLLDLMEQSLLWAVLWRRSLSVPGGLVIIAETQEAVEILRAKFRELTTWIWSQVGIREET